MIKHLTDLGLNLVEIQRYIKAEKNNDQIIIKKILERRLHVAERELQNIQRVVSLLKNPMEVVKNTMSEPIVKETPSLRVLSKRENGTYDKTIGKLIIDLSKTIQSPDNRNNFVRIQQKEESY